MSGKITISVKALAIGGLCALLAAFVVIRQARVERMNRAAFESIGSYIGACQETGAPPTVEQLQERIKALDEAQTKAETEKK